MVSLINRYPPFKKLKKDDDEQEVQSPSKKSKSSHVKNGKTKNDDEEEVQSPLKKSKSSPVKNGKTKNDDEEEVKSPLKKSKSSPVKNGNTEKGPIPGIEEGQRSQKRIKLSELKVHIPPGKKKKLQQINLSQLFLSKISLHFTAFYRYENLKKFSFKNSSVS